MNNKPTPKPKPPAQAPVSAPVEDLEDELETEALEEPQEIIQNSGVVGVRYFGSADRRIMSVEDMEAIGATSDKPIIWSGVNSFLVPIDQIGLDNLEALLRIEGFEAV